jgi:hypothetical protein
VPNPPTTSNPPKSKRENFRVSIVSCIVPVNKIKRTNKRWWPWSVEAYFGAKRGCEVFADWRIGFREISDRFEEAFLTPFFYFSLRDYFYF